MSGSYVYALFRPDNGKVFYIGATGNKDRLKQHLASRRGPKAKLIRAFIDVLGYTDIPFVVIRDGLTVREAAELETILIEALGRHPDGPLLNVHLFSGVLDEATRQKMSASAKARDRSGDDEDWRCARMSDPETRAKMSASAKARTRTPEFEAKRLAAVVSPEAKAKRLQKMKNRGWITNGQTDLHVKLDDPIPEGWWRGRGSQMLSQEEIDRRTEERRVVRETWYERNRSMIWITNGITDKRVMLDNPVPEGWFRGRTARRE